MASIDIKVFGRTYLFAMLLLIGLTLFLHPGCFCLALELLSHGALPILMMQKFELMIFYCTEGRAAGLGGDVLLYIHKDILCIIFMCSGHEC